MTEDQVEKILAKDTLSESDKKLLDDFEPNSGKNALYSFFTPKWLCQVVYDLAKRYGFDENNGKILEPSAGTGNFLSVIKKKQNVTAFEIDSLNSKIIRKLYPEVKLYEQYFETAFLKAPRYTQRINKNNHIAKLLDNIDEDDYPKIAKMVKTNSGYAYVQDLIVNMMVDEEMTASATLYHVEEMM